MNMNPTKPRMSLGIKKKVTIKKPRVSVKKPRIKAALTITVAKPKMMGMKKR